MQTLEITPDTIIKQLAAAVAQHIKPSIPVDLDLWDIETVATYMKRSPKSVRERLACLPDFPKAIRLPSGGDRGGQPLYRATEVMNWVSKFQDKN
jgi:membrane-bound lytic murein transglycosylase MltF